ncbi:MAG: hypothetical protein WC678_01545 [Parcubacteria group bacterium]|jgi:hypothetical protein
MNIFNKIDEIRKQPDHIRLRWAWGLTAVGMFFIVIIWMISFSAQISSLKSEEKTVDNINNGSAMQELSAQKKSIEDATSQLKNVLGKESQTDISNQ